MRWLGTIVLTVLLAAPVLGASRSDIKLCDDGDGDEAIAACGGIISDGKMSPRDRAMAFYKRADA